MDGEITNCAVIARHGCVQPFHTHPHRWSCSQSRFAPHPRSYVDAGSDLRPSGSATSARPMCPGSASGLHTTPDPRPRTQKWGPAIRGPVQSLNALTVTNRPRAWQPVRLYCLRLYCLRLYCSTHPNMRMSLRMLARPRVIIEFSLLRSCFLIMLHWLLDQYTLLPWSFMLFVNVIILSSYIL